MACDTVIDSYGTEHRNDSLLIDTVGQYAGQAFTMGGTARAICKAQFYLDLRDLNSGEYYTLNAQIRACTNTVGTNGSPTGAALATSSTITITYGDSGYDTRTLYDFIFSSPYTLSASTDYCVLCYITATNRSSSLTDVKVNIDSSGTHTGNLFYYTDSMYTPSNEDIIFYTFYDPVIGWTGTINGVTNPTKINGIAVADISKVNGVA